MSLVKRHKIYWLSQCLWRLFFLCLALQSTWLSAEALLWRVQSEQQAEDSVPVYLFGSIHYGRESFYPLPEFIDSAFLGSEILAVELNVRDIDAESAHRALARHGRYSGARNLKADLPGADWNLLDRSCKKLGLEVSQFMNLKPWLVATQLLGVQIQNSGFSQSLGIDQHFLSRASEHEIIELETLDLQLSLLGSMRRDDQLLFLRQSLLDIDDNPAYLNYLADAWFEGEESKLSEMILGAFQQEAAGRRLYQSLFVDRNINMTRALEAFVRNNQSVFMVVGVGHLLGRDGVVAQLKARNYRVERVLAGDRKLKVESPL